MFAQAFGLMLVLLTGGLILGQQTEPLWDFFGTGWVEGLSEIGFWQAAEAAECSSEMDWLV